MAQKICVYTCITGDYDQLNEIKHPEKHLDYYCFTNNKSVKSKTWKVIQLNEPIDNWRLARKIKILGHPLINNHYDIAVWTDANIVWEKPISEFITKYYKKETISIFKHFCRNNVYDEAIACLALHKDTKDSIVKTLGYLEQEGYPDNNGLYESTVFIKNLQNSKVQESMQFWYEVISKYSPRDQLSFPYAIWKTNLKIDRINLVVWRNNWFYANRHASNNKVSDCRIYYGNPSPKFDLKKYFVYQYKKTDNEHYSVTTTIPYNTNRIEISPLESIGLIMEDIQIKPFPTQTNYYGTATCNRQIISCINHSHIIVHGNFKKGQKFFFSIKLNFADKATIDKLIESFWTEKQSLTSENELLQLDIKSHIKDIEKQIHDNKKLLSDNHKLLADNQKLQDDLNSITNSKGWRILEKTRKIIPHYKTK